MSTRPRLIRSAPFWLLIAGSLASTAAGAYLLLDRLGGMDARLTDGTATSNDVYVGQIWAVLVGFALALTIGALRSLVPAPAVEVVEPPAWEEDAAAEVDAPAESPAEPDAADTESADDYGYESELGYEPNESEATTPAR
jgi:hypothetical protein